VPSVGGGDDPYNKTAFQSRGELGSVGGRYARISGELATGGVLSGYGCVTIVVVAIRQGRGKLPGRERPVVQRGHVLFGSPSPHRSIFQEVLPCFVVA
jgi:hypothetical protein